MLGLLAMAAPATAAPSLAKVGDFANPVYVTAPHGDAHRLFVVEQRGRIWELRDGVRQATPYLDVSSELATDFEQGLLSMAFAPDYATSRRVYIAFTRKDTGDGEVDRIVAPSLDSAVGGARSTVIRIQHRDATNHNGGQLQFGPDGGLYYSMGDGGSGNDPGNDAQNLRSPLGKLLRLDPSGTDTRALGVGDALPAGASIWAYGLRNPWRFSFDRANGEMWIGDVGQGAREEVDHAPLGAAGRNYGWVCREGFIQTPGTTCTAPNAVDPLTDYSHAANRCAIAGGFVVRDPSLAPLTGRFVFGDECTGETWSVTPDAPALVSTGLTVGGISSFGEDGCGHVYAASIGGPVYRIQSPTTVPCTDPLPPPPTGGGTTPPPAPGPKVGLRITGRMGRSGRVRFVVSCPKGAKGQCFGALNLSRRGLGAHLGHAVFSVPAGRSRSIAVRLTKRAQRTLGHRGRLLVGVGVRVTDAGGGKARSTARRVTLRGPARRR